MIELVLRMTESSGLVKEQVLARLDGGQTSLDADPVLEYSGLCIDSIRHQTLRRRAGRCKQCGVLYHREYPSGVVGSYNERIYPDVMGNSYTCLWMSQESTHMEF